MTGEEMERAIEFLLQNQATLEGRIARTQAQLSESQGQLNQTLTTAIIALAEAKSEAKVDRLTNVVEKLVERLSP